MNKILLGLLFMLSIKVATAQWIDERSIRSFRIPQDSYVKIHLLANLARAADKNKSPDLQKAISLLEVELVTDIAYLSWIIENHPADSEYSKYVLDKIVFGFRQDYFGEVENLNSEKLVVGYEENAFVNLKKIYESVKLNEGNRKEFEWWFEKYFPKEDRKGAVAVRSAVDDPNDEAEQAGTEQPATSPKSDSEGSYKPQTESEGRPR